MGPLKRTEKGNLYILLAIDSFSKWIMAKPIPDQKAETVSDAFVEIVIHKHSTPEIVVTDQGRQFTSEIFNNLSKIYGFEHFMSTAYHQQSNGQAEGSMRILANIISQLVNEKGNNWDELLSHSVFAYNTSTHTITRESPFYIIYLRNPRLPIDRLLKLPSTENLESDISVYTKIHSEKASKAWKTVYEEIKKAQEKFKNENDFNRKAVERNFEIGDLVLLKKEVLKHKFDQRWIGPFRIIGLENDKKNAIIQALDNKGKMKKVHQEKIKKYNGPVILPLREADEPLSWEKFMADPNLELEEAEENDLSEEEINENINERINYKNEEKSKKSLIKFGFESNDEELERENKIAFLKKSDENELNADLIENEVIEWEEPCTITEIFIDDEKTWAYTSWPEANLISLTSLIPTDLVKNDWEQFTNEFGKKFIRASIFGQNFELFLSNEADKIVLGIQIQFLINDEWNSKMENEIQTYWEQLGEIHGQIFELQRIPQINISYNENLIIEKNKMLNNNINDQKHINVIRNKMQIETETTEDKINNFDNNYFENIITNEENSAMSTINSFKDDLAKNEEKLRGQIDELAKELRRLEEKKRERERKRVENEKIATFDEVVLDFEDEEEEEKPTQKKPRLDPTATKEIVKKIINEEWRNEELLVIDPRGRNEISAENLEECRKKEDEIRAKNREKCEEAMKNFVMANTSLDKAKEARLKALNETKKADVEGEIKDGKYKKPTDPSRVLRSEIRAAEMDIKEKQMSAIPPEGKGWVINELERKEENRKTNENVNNLSENLQKIYQKIGEVKKEAQKICEDLGDLLEEAAKLVKEGPKCAKIRNNAAPFFGSRFDEPNTPQFRRTEDNRWHSRGQRGRWSAPRGRVWHKQHFGRSEQNEWNGQRNAGFEGFE